MEVGKWLKILITCKIYSFLYLVKWDKGGCKLQLFLVFIMYNSALYKNKFLLLTTNINTEYMYWADKGKIFYDLKKLST